jgi:hypothetical protein
MNDTVVLDVSTLPTIQSNNNTNILSQIEEYCYSLYRRYVTRNCMILFTIMAAVIGVSLAVLTSSKSATFPCKTYDGNSLASTVTLECLQYIWNTVCATKHPYTFDSSNSAWWLQSPQGAFVVRCIGGVITSQCGVGSYANILVYTQYCNPDYK